MTLWAVGEVLSSGGIDYAGLAALVTAVSGAIATAWAIVVGSRKQKDSTTEAALKLLLQMQAKQIEDDNKNQGHGP